jgi:hypothetical protein
MKSTPTQAGIADAQNAVEDFRYFEYRAILNARDTGAIAIHVARYLGHTAADGFEGIQHDSGAAFLHPISVVALLRHGPRITHHDDG